MENFIFFALFYDRTHRLDQYLQWVHTFLGIRVVSSYHWLFMLYIFPTGFDVLKYAVEAISGTN